MKIVAANAETDATYEAEANSVTSDFIQSMANFELTDDQIKRMIDNLNISADAKSLLYSFSRATLRAGEYVLKIGRKIIDYVCSLVKGHPNVSFGLIFGAMVSFLIASIPVIGFLLGPLVAPILIAFGMIGGLYEDLKDNQLERKIAEIQAKFSPLKA